MGKSVGMDSIRLSLNYVSFSICSLIASLFFLKKKFDLIFVFGGSAVHVGLTAVFIKKIKKIPIFLWVLDIWPESVSYSGNLKSDLIPKILLPLVKFIYKHSDRVLVSSRGFIKSIEEKDQFEIELTQDVLDPNFSTETDEGAQKFLENMISSKSREVK